MRYYFLKSEALVFQCLFAIQIILALIGILGLFSGGFFGYERRVFWYRDYYSGRDVYTWNTYSVNYPLVPAVAITVMLLLVVLAGFVRAGWVTLPQTSQTLYANLTTILRYANLTIFFGLLVVVLNIIAGVSLSATISSTEEDVTSWWFGGSFYSLLVIGFLLVAIWWVEHRTIGPSPPPLPTPARAQAVAPTPAPSTMPAIPTPSGAQKKYCRYCGLEIKSDSVFCEACGKKIAEA